MTCRELFRPDVWLPTSHQLFLSGKLADRYYKYYLNRKLMETNTGPWLCITGVVVTFDTADTSERQVRFVFIDPGLLSFNWGLGVQIVEQTLTPLAWV